MSYLVLARKYRPMFFEDVVGQEHVTKTLQNAIEQNRIANAYLFTGPRGVGKTTVARILSKAINCDHGPTKRPCNECSSCIEVNESRSLDVLEIDGASNRGIDEVRNLRESLRYSPNPGKYRIHIIDEVHMLTNEAFNALLKTLEEPPPRVLFIFATTEPHKVPTTILSRCQRFDFKRITTKRIIALLTELCEKESISINDESLRLIATKGDGSMRDAESILDQIIAYSGMSINADDTANLLGIIGHELFFKVTDLITSHDVQGGIELVQQIFAEGYDFSEFLIGLSDHLRNLMVVKSTEKTDELNVAEEHAQRYINKAHDFEIEDCLRLIKICSDAENLVRKSGNARLHLEMALIRMIKLTKSVQLSELLSQFQDAKKKSDVTPAANALPQNSHPIPTVAPARFKEARQEFVSAAKSDRITSDAEETGIDKNRTIESAASISFEDIENKWPEVIERVKRKKIALGSLLTEGRPTRIEGIHLELAFDGKNGFHITSVERQAMVIEETVEEVFGCRLKLKCIKVEKEAFAQVRKTAARFDKKAEFEKLEREDDMVRLIIEKFDAEFIK